MTIDIEAIRKRHEADKTGPLVSAPSQVHDDRSALLAELDRVKSQRTWQPIETAPKDMTHGWTMSFDENKPRPKVGDKVRENYGAEHIATWVRWGHVLAVVDDGMCIVIKRWSGRRGWQYRAIHWIEWCTMPYEIKGKRDGK